MKKFWKIGLALVVGLLIGLAIGLAIPRHSTVKASVKAPSEPTRAQLLTLVNAERAKYHVAPLTEDPRLDASAQMKAQDEITYNYFGHVSPKNSPHAGMQGYKFIDPTGIVCTTDSENLAEIWPITAEQAVKQWDNSPPHHQAMIDPRYSLTGFGIDQNEIVEHFCSV